MTPAGRGVLRVGLTGGIASGKSTVAARFARLGALVVDADAIVHGLLSPGGGACQEVARRFGPEILDPRGGVDRRALGARVFGDPAARADLEAIVHPRVREEIERRLAARTSGGGGGVAVVDAALLVETGRYREFDRLVVVSCRRETQIRRLTTRDGLSAAEAEARLAAQAPLEDKLAVADYVVDTDGTLEETWRQTDEIWAALLRGEPRALRRGPAPPPPRRP